MPAVNRITRRDLMTLALIVLVAAIMRLGEPGVVEFKHDEAWVSRMALDMVNGGEFPLTGMPSSVGVPNPPISVYLMALPYALSTNPMTATLFVAALNVIGVGLLWLLAHRYTNRTVALVAGLAYALSPWAVLYSRKIWAQDLHTPFVLLALLLGMVGFGEGKRWAQALCLPVLIFALQIHFAALALLPLYAWLLWIGRRRLSWAALLVSVLLAGLTLAPFAVGLARTLEQDPQRLSNALNRDDEATALSADSVVYTAQLATGIGAAQQIAPDAPDMLLASVPAPTQIWALLGGLALVGLVVIWTQHTRAIAVLVVLWAALPLVVFLPAWTPVHPHYFIASIPALCLLVGVGLDWLVRRAPGKPFSRTILLSAFVGIVLTQGVWWRGLLRYAATTPTDGFGTPLGALMPLRAALLAHDDVLLIVDDARLDYSEEPAVWSVILYDPARCVRALSDESMMVIPSHPFAAVFAPGAPEIALYARGEPSVYPAPPGDAYRVYTFDPAALEYDTLTTIPLIRFSNGAQLDGYHIDAGQVGLAWTLPAAQPDDYHYFMHLLDANGERVAQYDAAFFAGRYWCADDTLLTLSPLDVPDNAATLRVGLYRLEGERFINADALDEAGNATAPWADIPLE